MATMYITEYEDVVGPGIPVGVEPAIAEQTVTFTTTTASAAFDPRTKFVMIVVDAAAHLKFGAAPTATTSNQKVAANQEIFRGVKYLQPSGASTANLKVAAVTA